MKKVLLFSVLFVCFLASMYAQPSRVEGAWVTGSYNNNIGTLTARTAINNTTVLAYRGQSTATGATRTLLFNNSGGNYNPKWVAINNAALSKNTRLGGGAKYYTSGGNDINFVTVQNSYYTFIIGNNSSSNNDLAIWETSYNPRDIASVTRDLGTVYGGQSPTITVTMSGALNSGERLYVYYSTDNFATSGNSAFVQISSLNGSNQGTASIPAFPSSTVVNYYVLTTAGNTAPTFTDVQYQSINIFNGTAQNTNAANFSYTVAAWQYNASTTGIWSAAANWNANAVPSTINNLGTVTIPGTSSVTLDQAATVSNLTINSGGTFNGGSSTLTITSGGTISNSGSFVGSSGTVVCSGSVTSSLAAPTFNNLTINGSFTATTNRPTVNGILQINAGGFIANSTSTPIYGNSSTLRYNSGTTYGRDFEWTVASGIIGTTEGYPNDVQMSSNTKLNYPNTNADNTTPRGLARDLIIDAGSSFFMDFGTGISSGALTVGRHVTNNGSLSFGDGSGGDIYLAGNYTQNGTVNYKSRALFFNATSGTQTISGSSTVTIPYLVFGSSGSRTVQLSGVDLLLTAPNGGNAVSFNSSSDVLDINGRSLTLGTSGQSCNISGSGFFNGSSSSNFSVQGTTTSGTYNFTPSTNSFNNFTINLTGSSPNNILNLGSDLSVNGTLTLTAGVLDIAGRSLVFQNGNTPISRGSGTITTSSTSSLVFGTNSNLGGSAFEIPVSTFTTAPTLANFTINRTNSLTLNSQLITATNLNLTTGSLLNVSTSTLSIPSGGTIVRTAGTLNAAPLFTTAANVTYSNTSTITTGPELPTTASILNNLVLNGGGQVNLAASAQVNEALTLTSGKLNLGTNTLTLAGTATTDATNSLRGSNSSNLIVQGSGAKSLFFDNSTPATVDATTGTNSLNNLTLSSSGAATLGNQLNLFGILDAPSGTTLNTGGFLVLRSNGTSTARVAANGAAGVSGTVDVERFTFNRRAWRLIGAPVFGSSNNTYSTNWQSSSIGTGTNIYSPQGPTNGFDGSTVSASALVWNYNTALWDNVTNTSDVLLKGTNSSGTNANFLFVRGDKTVVAGVGVTPSRAIIGARGNLFSGDQTVTIPAVASTGTQKYICVANPYASPINFETLRTDLGIGINQNVFYVWDPRISTTGGWVGMTRSSATNYTSSINAPVSFAAGEGANGQFIQSGASFFLLPTTLSVPSTSVVFKETHKATTVNATVTGLGNGLEDKFGIDLQLVNSNATRTIMDGVVSRFNNGFSKSFVNNNNEDYIKLEQSSETISILNGTTKTGFDGRPFITSADTLQLYMQRMVNGNNYEFVTYPSNFDATVTSAKLVDRFLNNETPISLSAKTTVPFSVTATAGSNAADRFMVVFNGTGALPNRGFSVTGEKLGTNKVKINWEAVNEFGVKHYELEHSTDGRTFSKINTQVGKNGNVTNSYTYTDNNPANGVNYYRIKTTQNNDIERYSTTITINLSFNTQQSSMVVYPNPVKGNVIGLQLQAMEKGVYSVRLLSIEGKEVYKQQLQVSGNSLSTTISPSTRLAQGTYTLQVVGKNNSYTQKVVVE